MKRFMAALSAWLLWTAAAPAADFEVGVNAYERGDYAAAYGELLPLAEQGNATAQYYLGLMYEQGRGVPQSDAQAVEWYRKAAEQGLARAQSALGFKYQYGRGVPQDDVEAAAWYRKAAEQGEGIAQIQLGFMYAIGEGVPKDAVRAYAWFNISAAATWEAAGPEGAARARSFAARVRDAEGKSMTAAQVAEAQRLSADLFHRIREGAED